MKRKPWFVGTYAVAVTIALTVSLIFNLEQRSTVQHQKTESHILPNDNFDSKTIDQLQKIVPKLGLAKVDYQPYLPTGGLNSADPRIMAWGPYMDITFGIPQFNSPMYTIREMSKKSVANFGPWKAVHTNTGQTYYLNTQHANIFMFYKGSTAIWVDIFPSGNFPKGLMNHMAPIANAVDSMN